MKRFSAAVLALAFLFVFASEAVSMKIDGIDNGVDWDGATVYDLIGGSSNCGVTQGFVKVKFDNKNSAVYLCFMFIDPALKKDNLNAGISVQIEGSTPFVLTMSNSPSDYDIDSYSCSGAMTINEHNGATCEMRIGFKSGVPQRISGSVRFIDAEGAPSNYYPFTLINEEYSEPTNLIISPTADNKDPAYNPNLMTERSTKAKSEKTTKQKTTRATTTKFYIQTSPPVTYTGKTKAQTTKRTTTKTESQSTAEKVETTKKKQTSPVGATIYYYEKEVIISVVTAEQQSTNAVTEALVISETESEKAAGISLSNGTKYKKAAIAIGIILFLTIAAAGTFGAKKSRTNSEITETSSTETDEKSSTESKKE